MILGALVSSHRLDMRIAEKKRRAYALHLREFLEKHKDRQQCDRKDLERLLRGRLGFAAMLLRLMASRGVSSGSRRWSAWRSCRPGASRK